MLTLDEPDPLSCDGCAPSPGGLSGTADAGALEHLFVTMRVWFDALPRVTPRDPDRLYRRHGDPRD